MAQYFDPMWLMCFLFKYFSTPRYIWEISLLVLNSQNTSWENGWNETYAWKFCNESFTNDLAVTTCIEKVNTSASEYIKSCFEDIKVQYLCVFVELLYGVSDEFLFSWTTMSSICR